MEINQKVAELRRVMIEKGLDAYIIPSTDPHISEYVADRWKTKTWISGFTGSVATFVITKDKSGLWVDSRYWLQADKELAGTEITVFYQGKSGVLNHIEWLITELPENSVVGYDGFTITQSLAKSWKESFSNKSISVNSDFDLPDLIWNDRPSIPTNEIFTQKLEYAGKSRNEKISEVREQLKKKGADLHLFATLDDICWLFNIRGRDVMFNPVAYCYALISPDTAELYLFPEKVNEQVRAELESDGISLFDYNEFLTRVSSLQDKKVFVDPARVSAGLYSLIPDNCKKIEGMNLSTMMKAVKNETELSGMRAAMKRDCFAMVNFIYWMEKNLGIEKMTEISVSEKLREVRAESDMFFGESFGTIAGYKGNGAIVHYSSTPETDAELKKDGFFLLDSGGQYFDGTTDITRVFHLGEPTEEEKNDYTLVLKGHINLNLAIFPENTRGTQLDILARNFMWQQKINYGHGTGHGVGCFMNVHEGPQNIRMDENPVTLQPGMIISNEPGIYRKDKYGIRIENLINVVELEENDFAKFLGFEVLTLCPIDKKAINKDMMTEAEINWLNNYHKTVFESVSDLLSDDVRNWLAEKTSPL